mmetsp:Transcript_5716/g.11915  ORF Transcript_5716/g.11915 Transcript_5716/m.11915 type:complete len:367 (+) Transcript_5716:185-1285(+)
MGPCEVVVDVRVLRVHRTQVVVVALVRERLPVDLPKEKLVVGVVAEAALLERVDVVREHALFAVRPRLFREPLFQALQLQVALDGAVQGVEARVVGGAGSAVVAVHDAPFAQVLEHLHQLLVGDGVGVAHGHKHVVVKSLARKHLFHVAGPDAVRFRDHVGAAAHGVGELQKLVPVQGPAHEDEELADPAPGFGEARRGELQLQVVFHEVHEVGGACDPPRHQVHGPVRLLRDGSAEREQSDRAVEHIVQVGAGGHARGAGQHRADHLRTRLASRPKVPHRLLGAQGVPGGADQAPRVYHGGELGVRFHVDLGEHPRVDGRGVFIRLPEKSFREHVQVLVVHEVAVLLGDDVLHVDRVLPVWEADG